MTKPAETLHLSVSIDRSLDDAYELLHQPANFAQWASGLAGSLKHTGDKWIADTPEGPMTVRFSERNAFGVLDHWIVPASGAEIYIPLRIVANGSGCELTLTLFRQPAMTDDQFKADADWVMRDLNAAKTLLESR